MFLEASGLVSNMLGCSFTKFRVSDHKNNAYRSGVKGSKGRVCVSKRSLAHLFLSRNLLRHVIIRHIDSSACVYQTNEYIN